MKLLFALLLAGVGLAVAKPPQAQGTQAPANSAAPVSMCIGCHAIPGYQASFPTVYRVPKIGGQGQAYIEAALKAYRQGARNHPSMTAVARGLSDQQITSLAEYYASRGNELAAAK